jgi:hypothetical protein
MYAIDLFLEVCKLDRGDGKAFFEVARAKKKLEPTIWFGSIATL